MISSVPLADIDVACPMCGWWGRADQGVVREGDVVQCPYCNRYTIGVAVEIVHSDSPLIVEGVTQ